VLVLISLFGLTLVNGFPSTSMAFSVGSGEFKGTPTILKLQPDGKVILGGDITVWNGEPVGSVVRLNADGTIDSNFVANSKQGANGVVQSIVIQTDSKIVVAGSFTRWNGEEVGRIVRLNADGTVDRSFAANIALGANGVITNVALQPDGKLVVLGYFTLWNSGSSLRIVRLNADGTVDSAFREGLGCCGSNGQLRSVVVQPNGRILISGDFYYWNGVRVGGLIQLNSDGSRDNSFIGGNSTDVGYGGGSIEHLAVQPDGSVLAVGTQTRWNGVSVGELVRLNSDGSLDQVFTEAVRGDLGTDARCDTAHIFSVVVNTDGKILVIGSFTKWRGQQVGRVVRLNPDGSLDSEFVSKTGSGASADLCGVVYQAVVDSSQQILISGAFTKWNGIETKPLLRLKAEGTLDKPTVTSSTVTSSTVTSSTVTSPKVTTSKSATAKSIATFAKLKVLSTSKVKLKVVASSSRFCRVSGTTLKGLKAGSCKVTVTVTPKKGKAISKTVTLKVTK
jgi:uncharacterized delta-60 repeat protein